jgi:hypothetical protein
MLTKANPDNKTLADDPVVVVAVQVPDDEAVNPVLHPVETQTVDDEQTLQFDGHAVVHVGAAVAYPGPHNKQFDVEFDNQQFDTPVPVTYEPLAYKIDPLAGPPVHAVPFAVQLLTTPAVKVYPKAATAHVAPPTVHVAQPTLVVTQVPGQAPEVVQVEALATQV